MATNKYVTGISITKDEKLIVDEHKERLGISSFSTTLGMIIREWAEMKKQYVTIPKVGKVAPDGTVTFSARVQKWSKGEYGEYRKNFPNTLDPRD